jgi:hypothetical protein
MDLFRDLLDAELRDKHQRTIGRVDGLTIELHDGEPPRVVTMNVGAGTAADRIHPRLGAFVRMLLARTLGVPGEPVEIPMHTIRDIGVDVQLAVDAERDPNLLRTEKALRPLIRRIPGGGGGGEK